MLQQCLINVMRNTLVPYHASLMLMIP